MCLCYSFIRERGAASGGALPTWWCKVTNTWVNTYKQLHICKLLCRTQRCGDSMPLTILKYQQSDLHVRGTPFFPFTLIIICSDCIPFAAQFTLHSLAPSLTFNYQPCSKLFQSLPTPLSRLGSCSINIPSHSNHLPYGPLLSHPPFFIIFLVWLLTSFRVWCWTWYTVVYSHS